MNLDYEKIGSRIRNLRKEKKYTQEDLASRTDLTYNQIGNIECARSKPSLESLIAISSALEVSTDYLLFGYSRFDKDSTYVDYSMIMLDCNNREREIIIETLKTLSTQLKK